MAKFSVSETYTPDDRKSPRNTENSEFHTDSKDPVEIAKAAMGCFGHDDFFEEFEAEVKDQLKDQKWSDDPDENGFEFSFYTNDGEYAYDISQLPVGSETPITDENFVAWAENRVALNPTYEDSVWDSEKCQYVPVTKTNTVERELALVIHEHANEMLCDYKASELREHLSDLMWNGTKGYGEMTREALLR